MSEHGPYFYIGYESVELDRHITEPVHAAKPRLRIFHDPQVAICGVGLAVIYHHLLFGAEHDVMTSGRPKCEACLAAVRGMGSV